MAPTPAHQAALIAYSYEHFSVTFDGLADSRLQAVTDLSLQVRTGEILGIVGESGSGKTLTGLAALGLLPEAANAQGMVRVDSEITAGAGASRRPRSRGRGVGLILQDATASLNPVRRIAAQMLEATGQIGGTRAARRAACQEALREVHLDPDQVWRKYPFELSGGMNQRVAIAMALLQQPAILIADEPTTALDVTTQSAVLSLLQEVRDRHSMAVVLISHDLAAVAQVADRIGVMYGGRLVELGTTAALINQPRHPYTRDLLDAIPDVLEPDQIPHAIPGQMRPRTTEETGCPFRDRCSRALSICGDEFPPWRGSGPDHHVACWNELTHD